MADAPLTHIFKFTASKIASLITDWVLSEMDTFIPHKNTNKSLILSQPWFSPEYAAAIAHRNHCFPYLPSESKRSQPSSLSQGS